MGLELLMKLKKNRDKNVDHRLEDPSLMPYIAQKGSIAIDGISLTSNDVDGKKNRFAVSLIPFTLENTTLGLKQRGDLVNIEIDVLMPICD